MSWMSENYHKVALGGGVVVLAAVGYLSWSKASAQQEALAEQRAGKQGEGIEVEGGSAAADLLKSLSEINHLSIKSDPDGRKVNLFNSVDLFVKDGDVSEVVDLEQIDDVHPGIPNIWWVNNRVDPSFADSPSRDKDEDGFTNLEEFEAETDPSDPKSYSLLVHKLAVDNVDSLWWLVLLNSSFGNDDLQFRYQDSKQREIRMRATDNIQAGAIFFKGEPAKGRFRAIEPGERSVKDPKSGRETMQRYYVIEDLSENKKGTRYEAAFRPRRANEPLHYQFDNTVTFVLNAAGQEGKKHVVRENESFKVTANGETFEYKLVKVDMGDRPNIKPLAAIVEYDDNGTKKTRVINLK